MRAKINFLKLAVLLMVLIGMPLFIADGAEQKHIRFVTVKWEPYYGPDLRDKGYLTELIRESLKRVGYTMTVEFVPWKRALHDTKNLYYDGLLGLFYSEDRAKWIAFSDPVDKSQMVFFTTKDREITWQTLQDLKPYKIGIERSYAYTEAFDHADFLDKEPVRKVELNLKKLVEGRLDLVAASRNRFLYWIKNNRPELIDTVKVVPKPLSVNPLYVGFPRADPAHARHVEDFNKGLSAIKKDGTFDRILAKHGFR